MSTQCADQGAAELFTVGHSTHSVAHFLGLLKRHNITAVCDVRSQPYSRYNPQYNKEKIASELKANGIAYVFLGKELGARSENLECYEEGKIQFRKLANETLFQAGLARLKKGMREYTIALMCAEKDPLICHRTILVARQLRQHLAIKHIREDGSIESQSEAETRLLAVLNIHPDIVRDQSQCLEQAYDVQGAKIGYVKE